MSIVLLNKQNLLRRGADNVLPSPHGDDDEFFDVLGPALEEVAGLQRDELHIRKPTTCCCCLRRTRGFESLRFSYRSSWETSLPLFPVTPTGGQMRPSLIGRSRDEHATAEPTQPLVEQPSEQ